MSAAPTNYVLKAYMSETDAINDTNTLYITSSTDGTLSNATLQTGTTTNDAGDTTYFHFFIFEKYWFRIETNELATEFQIDWDDGENNSEEKSNTSTIKYKNPRFVGITSKIFTKHGAHYPLIRAKSKEGYWSKWYTPYNTSNDITTVDEDLKYFRAQYEHGQNTAYVVSMEKNQQPRIPILVPANKPPIGVLKTDRKEIFSGIDNVSGIAAAMSLAVKCDNTTRDDVVVRVIYEDTGNKILESLLSVSGIGTSSTTQGTVKQVLRLELIDCRETTDATVTNKLASGERIYLYNDTATYDQTVAFVSTGNPIMSLNEPGNYVTVDASESSTRAQNVSIKQFYFDTDKLQYTHNSTSGGNIQTASSYDIGDHMASNLYTGPITDSTLTLSYSLDPKENLKDSYGLFLPQTRLIRVQAEDTSDDTDVDTVTDLFRRSEIESFKNARYFDGDTDLGGTPDVTTANNYIQRRPPSTQKYAALTKTYTMNGLGSAASGPNWCDLGSGAGSASSNGKIGDVADILGGSYPITNSTNTLESAPKTFVFMAKTDLYDRIHFRTRFGDVTSIGTPIPDNADDPAGSNFPAVEMQIFYPAFKDFTKTNIIWKPLRYSDGTTFNRRRGTSLYRSGVISWDIPEDWIKTKHYYNASPTAAAPTVDYSFGDNFAVDWTGVQERWRCQVGSSAIADFEFDWITLYDTAGETTGCWIDHDGNDAMPFTTYLDGAMSSASATDDITVVSTIGPPPSSASAFPATGTFKIDSEDISYTGKTDTTFTGISRAQNGTTGTVHSDNSTVTSSAGVGALDNQLKIDITGAALGDDEDIAEIIADRIDTLDNFSTTVDGDKVYITCIGPKEWGTTTDFTSTHGTRLKMVVQSQGTNGSETTPGKGPKGIWLKDSYALIIAFAADATSITTAERDRWRIHAMRPFTNAHSQAVEVKDPTHLSLNHFGIAQSISFVRRGKYQKIENRMGTAEIRKIGVDGGSIKFGGVDLSGDPNAFRKTMYEYQRDAVPVYIDVEHENDDFTRFFGIITSMSEDHPTAKVTPKFALTLDVTKIGMFDSDGKIMSEGLVSLGGEIEERTDYISFGGHKT